MAKRLTAARRAAAAVTLAALAALFLSCQGASRVGPPPQVARAGSIAPELAEINTAAYPEGTYTVVKGDTPHGVAAKLGIDYTLFSTTNGIYENTVLVPGTLLVVPRVVLRNARMPVTDARTPASGAGTDSVVPTPSTASVTQAPPVQVVASDGVVHAVSTGTVTAVHREYPGLGTAVIIESDVETVIYGGAFTPAVEKGARVSAGTVIGTGGTPDGVKATRFPK